MNQKPMSPTASRVSAFRFRDLEVGRRALPNATIVYLSAEQERQLVAQVRHVQAGWTYYGVAAQDLDAAVKLYVAVARCGSTGTRHAGSGPAVHAARHAGSGPAVHAARHAGSGPAVHAARHAGSGPAVHAARHDVLQAWQRVQDAHAALIARVETEPAPAIRPALIAAVQAIGHWPPPVAPANVVALMRDLEQQQRAARAREPLSHLLSYH